MAIGKKAEKALTPEEKLAQALVPTEEQTYPVPENWCWVRLSTLAKVITKGTTPSGGKSIYTDTGVSFLRVENLNEDGTISHENIAHIPEDVHLNLLKRSILKERDILISIAGTLGKTGIVRRIDLPLNTNQALAFVRLMDARICEKYIKYSIDSPVIHNSLLKKTKVTSIPNLTLEIIGDCSIPFAPISEQQRIVARIDSLFAKLDEAKEKAQAVVDSFEIRKAAILHKAFTGELTAQWRKSNGISKLSWEYSNLGKYASSQYGYTESASAESIGPKFLRITDIQDGQVDWKTVPYCNISQEKKAMYAIRRGDIVVARTGATTGKSYLVIDDIDAVYASYLIRVTLNSDKLIEKYLYLYFQSQEYWTQISEFSSGIAQPGVNGKKLRALEIPVPSVAEQIEISRILDKFLDKEQQAKEVSEAVIDQIDTIKKAILARAFRGELGTNDPAEESAVELLKTVVSH